jgi:hypothetical protein
MKVLTHALKSPPRLLSPLFYQEDQISFLSAPFAGARPRGEVREMREKSPLKPRMVWSSEVRIAAHYIDPDLDGFVAVEMLISLGQGWWS